MISVDIWSDIACPWCYVGKHRFEAALARFAHRDDVEVRYRAFELDPGAPREREAVPHVERIAKKYGLTIAQAEARTAHLISLAAAEGIELRFDRIHSGNTFDAHRLIQLAQERAVQGAVVERLFRAHFTDGVAIGVADEIAPIAADAGLDRAEIDNVLGSDAYAREVRADETAARALGIGGVPFFVIDGRVGVSGAHPSDALLQVLERARAAG